MTDEELHASIQTQFSALKEDRTQMDTLWPVIAKLMFSVYKDTKNQRTKAMSVNNELYDGSGQSALNIYASGIVSNVCPRGNTWFNYRYRATEANKLPGVPDFQKNLEIVMYGILAQQSNWYEFAYEFFYESAWACTAAAFPKTNLKRKTVTFHLLPTGSFWIAEDAYGVVDTLFRELWISNGEIMETWPDLPKVVMDQIKSNPATKQKILHAVRPRKSYNANDRTNKNFEWESTYWLGSTLLEESGYDRFPFLVHRVEREPGSVWGTGPGIRFIRDGQIQQSVAETMLLADQKLVDPAVEVPEDMRDEGYFTHPGGINWMPKDLIGLTRPTNANGQRLPGVDREDKLRQAVERAFSVPFFLMDNERGMTRAEFLGRQAQESAVLVPRYGRATSEVLDPMWPLLFDEVSKFQQMPKLPAALKDMGLGIMDVQYQSPFQTLQKRAHGMAGVESFITGIGNLRTVLPEAGTKILNGLDPYKVLDQLAEANGVDSLLTDDKYRSTADEQVRQAQVMQAQAQAQMQAMAAAGGKAPQGAA